MVLSRLRRGARRLSIVGALAGVLLVAFTGTALATSGRARTADYHAFGSSSWTFGTYSLTSIAYSVTDNSCDGHPVYIRLEVYSVNGPNGTLTTPRTNYNGCTSVGTWSGLSWSAGSQITGVRIVVGVDGGQTGRSNYIDNPNT